MVYRVLSWDVGIINLAYCVLYKNDDKSTEKYIVKELNIINLIDATEKKLCVHDKCKKVATYIGEYNKETYHYCGIHKGDYNKKVQFKEDDYMKKVLSKQSCDYDIKNNGTCNKTAYYEANDNKYYCAMHRKSYLRQMENNINIKKIPKKNCNKTSIYDLGQEMYTQFDKMPQLLQVDEVLIENQPSFKNPKMKTMAALIFGYFIMKGIMNDKVSIKNVKFISPSNKLKVYPDKTLEVLGNKNKKSNNTQDSKNNNNTQDSKNNNNTNPNDITNNISNNKKNDNNQTKKETKKDDKESNKTKYRLTKDLAKEYAALLLKDNNKWLDYFNKCKKKDDVADAFLQGYHYLYTRINI